MRTSLLSALAVALGASSLPAQGVGTILLNDSFADGERATQNLPTSAQWWSSSGGSNIAVVGNQLVQVTGTAGRGFVAYFTAPGTPFQITEGTGLRFTLTFVGDNISSPGTSGSNLRLGLINTGSGTRLAADNFGNSSVPSFGGTDAYVASFSMNSTVDDPTPAGLNRKVATSTAWIGSFGTSNANYSVLTDGGNPADQNIELQAGQTYTASVEVYNEGGNIFLQSFLNGPGIAGTQLFFQDLSGSPLTSFDAIGVNMGSNTVTQLAVINARVEVIPEPSALVLAAAGLLAVGLLARRRRA